MKKFQRTLVFVLTFVLTNAVVSIAAHPQTPVAISLPIYSVETEIASALYAASATQEAAQRVADSRLRKQMHEIDALRSEVTRLNSASVVQSETADAARLNLARAEERFVAELAERDRAYAQEIAAFRGALADIAATPEGLKALALFNAGNEAEAIAILDAIVAARTKAREARADIEAAAEKRQIAALALDAHNRGKLTTLDVLARFEEVTQLDPGNYLDWIQLSSLYKILGRSKDAIQASESAVAKAPDGLASAVSTGLLASTLFEIGQYKEASSARIRFIDLTADINNPVSTDARLRQLLTYHTYQMIESDIPNYGLAEDDFAIFELFRYAKDVTIGDFKKDPNNKQKAIDAARAQLWTARLLLRFDTPDLAKPAATESFDILNDLISLHPDEIQIQVTNCESLQTLGLIQERLGNRKGALQYTKSASKCFQDVAERSPDNLEIQWQTESYLYESSKFQKLTNVQSSDRLRLEKYIQRQQELIGRQPQRSLWKHSLAQSLIELSTLCAPDHDFDCEYDALNQADSIFVEILDRLSPLAFADYSYVRTRQGVLFSMRGLNDGADDFYRTGTNLYRIEADAARNSSPEHGIERAGALISYSAFLIRQSRDKDASALLDQAQSVVASVLADNDTNRNRLAELERLIRKLSDSLRAKKDASKAKAQNRHRIDMEDNELLKIEQRFWR